MISCSCGLTTADPRPVGIQRDYKDWPALILWNCASCGSTRAIPVEKASRALLEEAHEIDYARRIGEGLE